MGTNDESSVTGEVSGLEMTASQLAMSALAPDDKDEERANLRWGITNYIDGGLPIGSWLRW